MASVIQVVNRACLIMEEWGTKERQTVLEALKSLETEFDKSIELTISNAVAELEGFKSIATYSRSYLVEQTLLSLAGSGSKPKITLSQSQPGMEGITLGEKLHQAGLAVTICIDAALPQALKAASTFILGADAIFQHQFCNKIGSEMMCLSARNTGLPVYVIASPDKFLPAPLDRFFKIENPLDVGIDKENSTAPFQFNQLFELANIEYVDYIISDKILSPGQIRPCFHASPVAKILAENYAKT
jgi:ribose 1,5-bisphosphate isomerase